MSPLEQPAMMLETNTARARTVRFRFNLESTLIKPNNYIVLSHAKVWPELPAMTKIEQVASI